MIATAPGVEVQRRGYLLHKLSGGKGEDFAGLVMQAVRMNSSLSPKGLLQGLPSSMSKAEIYSIMQQCAEEAA